MDSSRTADHAIGQALTAAYPDKLWLCFERHYGSNDAEQFKRYQHLQRQLKVPITASSGVRMHSADRHALLDTLTAIHLNQPLSDIPQHLAANQEARLRSWSELCACYPDEWLTESVKIAARCTFDLSELKYEYPAELVPDGIKPMDHLRALTLRGADRRFPNGVPTAVAEKLAKEFRLIEQLNYAYFFLTIADIVEFAQQRGILYQGRGSAANSVVCYCLAITAVNPEQIDVLFERFISAERDEPPDIDVDFEHQRREEVIQYIYQKYTRERAALAATVITYRLRSGFRDVGKALGFAEADLARWLKKIDKRDQSIAWQHQLQDSCPELNSDPRAPLLYQLVDSVRGFPRHLSQHVGGFIISAGPLAELVPIENAAMTQRTVIQWDKTDLESLGLLKVDVLALGMLSALQKMLTYVSDFYQQPLDLASIPQDDPAVYRMLQQGDSVGVFQIESRAQMTMLPRLKPATFYDLVIQIAIVRPGPIQGDMVHPYLRRRAGIEKITYPNEDVAKVLQRTLGVPIFQEQVIKLAMVAAGFSGGEADQLRRAMANWKSTGELQVFEQRLIRGMLARGYEREFAERIYRQICGFGEYGFPESHSASFANLAYASSWLKHHYPAAFYTGLLNSLPMGFYSASQLIQDAQRHHVTILPVCIQASQWHHQLIRQSGRVAIRLGLRLIKGLSQTACEKALMQRPVTGFGSLQALQRAGFSAADLDKLAAADALQQLAGHYTCLHILKV